MVPDTRDTFDRIPKVELHCHVEGTVRSATVLDLARKAGRPLPVDDPGLLYRYDSLDSFLDIFWLIQELLRTRDDWARVAYESLVDASVHGLRYREMFFTPARHLADGQDLAEIIAGLTEGIEAAEAETGVRCRLIAAMDKAYGPAAAMELVEALLALRRAGRAERVIGVGADSTELGVDMRPFAPAFAAAAAGRAPADLPRGRGGRLRPGEHRDRARRPGRRTDRPRRGHRGGPGAGAAPRRGADPADGVPDKQHRHREPLPLIGRAPAAGNARRRAAGHDQHGRSSHAGPGPRPRVPARRRRPWAHGRRDGAARGGRDRIRPGWTPRIGRRCGASSRRLSPACERRARWRSSTDGTWPISCAATATRRATCRQDGPADGGDVVSTRLPAAAHAGAVVSAAFREVLVEGRIRRALRE